MKAFTPLTVSVTEMAAILYVDSQLEPLGTRWFLSRSVETIEVSIRAIVTDVLALDARSIVLAHNHPSGDVAPSRLDLAFTRRLFATLESIGVSLLDHYIVSRDGWMSFRSASFL